MSNSPRTGILAGGSGPRPPGGRMRQDIPRAGLIDLRTGELERALDHVRGGDTLVVTKVDWGLGHGIVGEVHHDQIRLQPSADCNQ